MGVYRRRGHGDAEKEVERRIEAKPRSYQLSVNRARSWEQGERSKEPDVRDQKSGDPRLLPAGCRWNDAVHTQILDHLPLVIAIFSIASRVKESFHIFARAKLVGRSPTRSAFRLEYYV